MATQKEIDKYAKLIVETHGGQMFFNLTEARKILNLSENLIARKLHEAGITVQKKGRAKMVSAYAIAEYMHYNHTTAVDF